MKELQFKAKTCIWFPALCEKTVKGKGQEAMKDECIYKLEIGWLQGTYGG